MLESAERRLLIIKHSVDRYPAGEDLRGYAACALNVAPAYVAVEAVARVVSDLDGIIVSFVLPTIRKLGWFADQWVSQ